MIFQMLANLIVPITMTNQIQCKTHELKPKKKKKKQSININEMESKVTNK